MTDEFTKPRSDAVQAALKVMKTDFDNPATKLYIPHLLRLVAFPGSASVAAWRGEMYHQLGEWFRRNGDECRADECLQRSIECYDPAEALGPARTRRAIAVEKIGVDEIDEAMTQLHLARQLHLRDELNAMELRERAKSVRQARITDATALEARIVGDDDRQTALDELVHIALYESRAFCIREQHDLVQFLLQHARGADKRALRVRQLEINARRRKPIGVATSMAQVVIDKELQVAGHVLGTVLPRKERMSPRP